jgi:YbbR domain-containing protein
LNVSIAKTAPTKKQIDYEYQPLSRMVHNKTLEITGAFDKMSGEEKAKTKTRGTDNPIEEAAEDVAV